LYLLSLNAYLTSDTQPLHALVAIEIGLAEVLIRQIRSRLTDELIIAIMLGEHSTAYDSGTGNTHGRRSILDVTGPQRSHVFQASGSDGGSAYSYQGCFSPSNFAC
jgi:hypothetical protein